MLTVLCTGICVSGYTQDTFKETTNRHKLGVINNYFMPPFMSTGGYENFVPDSAFSFKTIVKTPKVKGDFGRLKGHAQFFYELDTLANIKKIWISRLSIAGKSGFVIDDIVFLYQNHIGFELDYLREVEFNRQRKNLAIFLLENEWANRRFFLRDSRKKNGFDRALGNMYFYEMTVRFESED